VKAIPSMPGFLAITYFNKLIIHSLEGRIVEEQSIKDRDMKDVDIISLDISEVLIPSSSKKKIFILVGASNGYCHVFELMQFNNKLNIIIVTPSIHPDPRNPELFYKIISTKMVNFKSKNYLLSLLKDRNDVMGIFPLDNALGNKIVILDGIGRHYVNDFKAVANDDTIDIYCLNSSGKSRTAACIGDNFCFPITHYSLDSSFKCTLKNQLSSHGDSKIRISSDLMVEAGKPLFFSVGSGEFKVADISANIYLPFPYPTMPWVYSYFNPIPTRDSLFFPKIISKTETIIIELPFVFMGHEQKCNNFIIHLKDGERPTKQIFSGSLIQDLFMPREKSHFFYDIIVQQGKPFILLGDTRQGILCLDLHQLMYPVFLGRPELTDLSKGMPLQTRERKPFFQPVPPYPYIGDADL
jgi:hypothetical protein